MDTRRIGAAAFLLLVGLWTVGVVRSFFLSEPDSAALDVSSFSLAVSGDYRAGQGNWHNLAQIGHLQTPLPQLLDQDIHQIRIYDKTAQLSSGSTDFGGDEERLRTAIASHKAIVFNEKSTGISPARLLSLGISVHPERFDELVRELSRVGQVASFSVEQQDRTSEFRKLHAQRLSLKKHEEAILRLRDTKTLSVEEALKLEQKILELDKELQSVAVQLGDFLAKEPAYNLFFTLHELRPGSHKDRSFTIEKRLQSGLWWALGWWLMAALGVSVACATWWSIKTLRYR